MRIFRFKALAVAAAVCIHRKKGDEKMALMGSPASTVAAAAACTWPSAVRGGSCGRAAVFSHSGSTSDRSPWRTTQMLPVHVAAILRRTEWPRVTRPLVRAGRTVTCTRAQRTGLMPTPTMALPEERAAQLSIAPRLQSSFDAGDDAWTAARLQTELSSALAAGGLRGIDLIKAWQVNRHAGVTERGASETDSVDRKEYLVAMKRLCGSGDAWYAMARDASMEAFGLMDRLGDKSLSVRELCRWLDPHGRLIAAGRQKTHPRILATNATRQPLLPVQTGAVEEDGSGDAIVYSPTKLSTRLAAVRAFDPERSEEAARRARPPLWKHKEAPPPPFTSQPKRREAATGETPLSLEDCARGLDARGNPLETPRGARHTTERSAARAVRVAKADSNSAAPKPSSPVSSGATTPPSPRLAPKPLPPPQAPSYLASTLASARESVRPSPRDTAPSIIRSDEWYDAYAQSTATTAPRHSARRTEAAAPPSARAIKPWSALTAEPKDMPTLPTASPFAGMQLAIAQAISDGQNGSVTVTPISAQPKSQSTPSLSHRSTPRENRMARPASAPFRAPHSSRSAVGAKPPPAPLALRGGIVLLTPR